MAASTATAVELTQTQVAKLLLQPLQAASVFLAAGPRIFDTPGPLRLPKMTGMGEPSWHGENEQITEVDATFDEITLLPSTMKSLKSLTRFSNELARQSVVALDAVLQARMVADVAGKLDTALFASTVTDGTQPAGMLSYAGTQSIAVGGELGLDHLHDMVGKLLAAGVDLSRVRWVTRPETFTKLRKLKDGNQRYQLQPDPTADGVYRLLGHPVSVSKVLPTTTGTTPKTSVVLADFGQIAVARDLAASVKILDQTFGHFDQQAIRVVSRFDAKPMNAEAVVIGTGVNT